MAMEIEAFGVEVIGDGGRPVPEGAGAGVARLLAAMLARAGVVAEPLVGAGPSAPAARVPREARVRGQWWIGDRWQAEIEVNGERRAEEASFELGHHLLYRLTAFAAERLGGAIPEAAMRAFEDMETRSPGALLAYLAGWGAEGEERKRRWGRAFELDPRMVAPRLGLAAMVLAAGGEVGAAAGLAHGLNVQDGAAAGEVGIALWAAGETEVAAEMLQAAVKHDPQNAVAMAALAALLARRAPSSDGPASPGGAGAAAGRDGAWDEALLLATQATQLAADDYRCWAALADVHRAGGDFAQASFYYGFALRLEPEAATVLKDAGACWLLAHQPQQALPLIERALAVAPADAENHGNLAFARDLLGEAEAALAAARRAAELSPGDARMRILHGDLALKAGAQEEALEAWARAAELEPGMVISPAGGNVGLVDSGARQIEDLG
ncbi:MAG TPA: hypothetical protein VNF74_01295 [Terriglobales bacterium]|nr:hypothetical protein [Terriglobales bacterium]